MKNKIIFATVAALLISLTANFAAAGNAEEKNKSARKCSASCLTIASSPTHNAVEMRGGNAQGQRKDSGNGQGSCDRKRDGYGSGSGNQKGSGGIQGGNGDQKRDGTCEK